MSERGVNRVGNYIWDLIGQTWVKQETPAQVSISGVTPVGGKIPVDTEISVSGDVIVERVRVATAPLTEVYASGTFPVTDNSGSLTIDDGGGSPLCYYYIF